MGNETGIGDTTMGKNMRAWAQHREQRLRCVVANADQRKRVEQGRRSRTAGIVFVEAITVPVEEESIPRRCLAAGRTQMLREFFWRTLAKKRQQRLVLGQHRPQLLA